MRALVTVSLRSLHMIAIGFQVNSRPMKQSPQAKVLAILGALLLPGTAALALPVTGLYNHEVAVTGQSETERNNAFREALSAVVVKVTGNESWLENSAVRQALSNARSLVQEIQYRTENLPAADMPLAPSDSPVTDVTPPGSRTLMNVIFAREAIDRLLASAAIPVWDSNRPSILVWMVLQNDNGERRLLSADSQPEIVGFIQEFARLRGVPILFPVLDFEDRQSLSADQLWALDAAAIRQASNRYGADSILAGRLHLANSGDLVGLWQFQFQDQNLVFDSFDSDLKNYVFEPLNLVTTRLAEHFAIVRPNGAEDKIRLKVSGVRDLSVYSSLVKLLQGLSVVNSVVTSGLDGDNLELELSLLGSRQQFYELIALDRALQPVSQRPTENDSVLSYRWTR